MRKGLLEWGKVPLWTIRSKNQGVLNLLLALADNRLSPKTISGIPKMLSHPLRNALKELSDEASSRFYNIQEIVSFAKIIDETKLHKETGSSSLSRTL